jgi:hypothetical protein
MKLALLLGNTPRKPIVFLALLAGPVFAGFWYLQGMVPAHWSLLQWGLFLLLTEDLIGGIVMNLSDSNQAYWQEQPLRMRMVFLGIHAIQPALLLLAWDYMYAPLIFLYMIVCGITGFLLKAEARRIFLVTACFAGIMLFTQEPSGMEWFVPAYFLKLLVSYALPHRVNLR